MEINLGRLLANLLEINKTAKSQRHDYVFDRVSIVSDSDGLSRADQTIIGL